MKPAHPTLDCYVECEANGEWISPDEDWDDALRRAQERLWDIE